MLSLFFGEIMNAKMVITVPMERIPKEVKRILNDINNDLTEIIADTTQIINSEDYLKMIDKLDILRKKLALLDLSYEDCHGVLQGYVRFLSQKDKQPSDSNGKEDNSERNTNG